MLDDGFDMEDLHTEFNSRDAAPIPPGLFFALPTRLLSALEKYLGAERFDADRWQMENRLASTYAVGDVVGFWRGQLISSDLIRPEKPPVTPDLGAWLGLAEEEIEWVNSQGAGRVEWLEHISRAYAGWLLINPTFLAEHERLLGAWQADVGEYGIPSMGPVVRSAPQVRNAQLAEAGNHLEFLQAFEEFFIRWRLQGMAAPFLPRPLPPQLPVPRLELILGHMRHGGQTFYLPDTFPVPTRDELREIMEDALRGGEAPEHLTDWMQIIRASNPARNALNRFARILVLKHYWQAIFARHGGQLRRARGHVGEALAEFLGTSPDTIRDDLSFISERLGYDWES